MQKFTEQEIDKAISKAPVVIQEALVTDPFLDFGLHLQTNYQLHVDVAGGVGNLMSELLVGLIGPKDFFAELQALGIPVATAQQLTKDLNEKIFTPLQAKMLNGGAKDPSEPSQLIPDSHAPSTVRAPLMGALPPATEVLLAPPHQEIVPPPLVAQAPISVPPAPIAANVAPPPTPVASFVPPPPTPPPPSLPTGDHQTFGDVRTMASDMTTVKAGGFPAPLGVNPQQTPASFTASQPSPAPVAPSIPTAAPAPSPAPIYSAPPPVMPPARPAMAPQIQHPPRQIPPIASPAPATPNENRAALHEVLKAYGVDPYREPAE